MIELIDIRGLDKAVVLAALFNAAVQPLTQEPYHYEREEMSVEEARGYLSIQTEFDTLRGKPFKVYLDAKVQYLNPKWYDISYGPGAAARVIDTLRI